jgi:hypothetical protein
MRGGTRGGGSNIGDITVLLGCVEVKLNFYCADRTDGASVLRHDANGILQLHSNPSG